ncbi:MAG TPA: DUF2127 domain-containing protein [Desulfuromonadaceae bacterium]
MMRSRAHRPSAGKPYARGLHVVALFEGAKGVLVLAVGFELLSFIHKDIHEAAMRLVEHLHFNPASHYPRIFLDLTEHINDTRLWSMALAAAAYSVVRLVEAVGLWQKKAWAEWFGVLTGGMYIPVELFEVARKATWPRVTVLAVNSVVVSYLLFVLIRSHKRGGR